MNSLLNQSKTQNNPVQTNKAIETISHASLTTNPENTVLPEIRSKQSSMSSHHHQNDPDSPNNVSGNSTSAVSSLMPDETEEVSQKLNLAVALTQQAQLRELQNQLQISESQPPNHVSQAPAQKLVPLPKLNTLPPKHCSICHIQSSTLLQKFNCQESCESCINFFMNKVRDQKIVECVNPNQSQNNCEIYWKNSEKCEFCWYMKCLRYSFSYEVCKFELEAVFGLTASDMPVSQPGSSPNLQIPSCLICKSSSNKISNYSGHVCKTTKTQNAKTEKRESPKRRKSLKNAKAQEKKSPKTQKLKTLQKIRANIFANLPYAENPTAKTATPFSREWC